MAAEIVAIGDHDFEAGVLQARRPVLVDFHAPWCGPCKAIGPVLQDLARTYGERVKFVKCNVDENPVAPGKFGIKAIPALIFFRDGQETERIVGVVAKSKLEESLDAIL